MKWKSHEQKVRRHTIGRQRLQKPILTNTSSRLSMTDSRIDKDCDFTVPYTAAVNMKWISTGVHESCASDITLRKKIVTLVMEEITNKSQ